MKEENKKLVYIAAMIYALITGLSFLFTKIALSVSQPLDILAFRFTSAFVAILLAWGLKLVKLDFDREKVKRILPLALLYPLLFFAFQTFGLQYATSSEAGILLAAAPVFTLILARIFLGEKPSLLQTLSLLVSVIGVIYITVKKGSSIDLKNMKGIIFLKEDIFYYHIIGSILIIGGVIGTNFLDKAFNKAKY